MPCCFVDVVPPVEELYLMAKSGSENVSVVQRYVKEGVNINHRPKRSQQNKGKKDEQPVNSESVEERYTTLQLFALHGKSNAFKACMESELPVEFSGRDATEWETSILFLCTSANPEAAKAMVAAVVNRLMSKKSKNDKLEWAQRNQFGKNSFANAFLSHVVERQVLHLIWPLLHPLPFFKQHKDSFPVRSPICEDDWNQLTEKEKLWFTPLNGIADAPTCGLWGECVKSSTPDVNIIEEWVMKGGQIQKGMDGPISPLEKLIMYGAVDCVAACMETALPIHFTLYPETGRNVLILVCQYCHAKMAKKMIKVFTKRIMEKRPEDTINWELKNASGSDFFSVAAYYDFLHVVWPLLRSLPPFSTRTEAIPINAVVTEEDWGELGNEQLRFRAMEGFIPRRHRLRGDRYLYRKGVLYAETWEAVRWEKSQQLGVGSFGGVYLGRLENEMEVAVKVQNPNSSFRSLMQLNLILIADMEAMKCLRHQNLVQLHATQVIRHGSGSSQLQIIMEYCPGYEKDIISLKELMNAHPSLLNIVATRRYMRQALEALAYLHRNYVLHREIKPSNILLTKGGKEVKLSDYGCMKNLKEQSVQHSLMGSKMYLSPEVLDASKGNNFSKAGDIWSFGCTVLCLTTKDKPWLGELSELQLITRICYSMEMPSGFVQAAPHMDGKLKSFLEGCFSQDPQNRPTAEALLKSPWMTCPDGDLS